MSCVSVQNSFIQNSPMQNSPKNYSKVQKIVPYKTFPKIVQKTVQKTVSLIELIIVPELISKFISDETHFDSN